MSVDFEDKLLEDVMHDGSLHFAIFPQVVSPLRTLLKIFTLWGAYPTAYLPSVTETWIDFRYKGNKFSIHNPMGDFWFFVENPNCSKTHLIKVMKHFESLLSE